MCSKKSRLAAGCPMCAAAPHLQDASLHSLLALPSVSGCAERNAKEIVFLVQPDDNVPLVLQVGGANTNVVQALFALLHEGGVPALYRGLGAASLRIVPMAIASFGTYEIVRAQYTRLEEHLQMLAAQQARNRLPSKQLLTCQH